MPLDCLACDHPPAGNFAYVSRFSITDQFVRSIIRYGFRSRTSSAGSGRARGRCDPAHPAAYSRYISYVTTYFGLGFHCDVFTIGDGNDRPIRPGVSRDRHERWPLHSAHLTSSPLAAPLTLNRLPGRTGILHHPTMRWSPRTTFETTLACFAVPS
jgi:hypothetical protein